MKRIIVLSISLFTLAIVSSCSKHGAKVEGTYIGDLSINDSLISTMATTSVLDRQKENISLSSTYFDEFQVSLTKKRYFGSILYFSNDNNRDIEFTKSDDQILLTLIFTDGNGDKLTYIATRQ